MAEFCLDLTEDQLQVQRWVHRFAEEVVRPVAAEWDEREETPWPVIEEAARIGLYSLDFLTDAFADPAGLTTPILMEEMAWGDAGISLAIFGTTLAVTAILRNGTPDQVAEWLPRCFEGPGGRPAVAAFAVTEADAGSDVSSLRCRAARDVATGDWVLDGTKAFVTNGGIAGVHVIVAAVDPALGSRGQASFVVPPGTAGLAQGRKYRKMGIRASHTAEVVLRGCRVPESSLLGGSDRLDEKLARAREGRSSGRSQAALATFEASRPTVGAGALGIARAAYEYALDYARHRRQFGRAIVENQAIAFKLADMKTLVDASRLLVWRAAWMGRNKRTFDAGEGSMSKLFASEAAVRVTEEAIQILGGYGYMRDLPVERWHRDAKIYTLFEGTSEIQRLIVSRAISGVQVR
ncbi:MAG TPA: acyl-CoA dehydrogenase family protein [Acidimicrobiales bacterium]|nr:acyl-CoA dehydrogenase family protein [Acidimicrobiales bacterium]